MMAAVIISCICAQKQYAPLTEKTSTASPASRLCKEAWERCSSWSPAVWRWAVGGENFMHMRAK